MARITNAQMMDSINAIAQGLANIGTRLDKLEEGAPVTAPAIEETAKATKKVARKTRAKVKDADVLVALDKAGEKLKENGGIVFHFAQSLERINAHLKKKLTKKEMLGALVRLAKEEKLAVTRRSWSMRSMARAEALGSTYHGGEADWFLHYAARVKELS